MSLDSGFLASFKYAFAALNASFITHLLHPLDVIKIRFQSHDGSSRNVVPKYTGISAAFKEIYRCEGIRGLYKGLFASIIGQSLARVLFFTIYELRKEVHSRTYGKKSTKAVIRSSLESGMVSVIITQPLWIIKTRLQLNLETTHTGFDNLKNVIKEIYHHHRLVGFYRGMSLSLVLSLHVVSQISIYEKLMNIKMFDHSFVMTKSKPFFYGMISKFIVSSLFYPITTIRTRIQQNQFFSIEQHCELKNEKYKNIRDVTAKIVKNEGFVGFYKGFLVNALKALPSKGAFFFFYEIFKDAIFGADHRVLRGT